MSIICPRLGQTRPCMERLRFFVESLLVAFPAHSDIHNTGPGNYASCTLFTSSLRLLKKKKGTKKRQAYSTFCLAFGYRTKFPGLAWWLHRSGVKGEKDIDPHHFLFDILFHLHSIRNICISLSKPTLIIPFLWSLDSPPGFWSSSNLLTQSIPSSIDWELNFQYYGDAFLSISIYFLFYDDDFRHRHSDLAVTNLLPSYRHRAGLNNTPLHLLRETRYSRGLDAETYNVCCFTTVSCIGSTSHFFLRLLSNVSWMYSIRWSLFDYDVSISNIQRCEKDIRLVQQLFIFWAFDLMKPSPCQGETERGKWRWKWRFTDEPGGHVDDNICSFLSWRTCDYGCHLGEANGTST